MTDLPLTPTDIVLYGLAIGFAAFCIGWPVSWALSVIIRASRG
jgi:hypothetical protein